MTRAWIAALALGMTACASAASQPARAPSAVANRASSPAPTWGAVTPGPANPPPAGGWYATPGGLPLSRAYFTGTRLQDGRALIVGGVSDITVAGSASADVEIYDPSTTSFSAAESLAMGRAGHTATLLRDGRVLVAGGYTQLGSRALRSAEIYDPSTGHWSAAASLSTRRSFHAAVLLADGRVLIVGGSDTTTIGISPHGAVSATLAPEIYDPVNDTWSAAAMPAYDRPMDPTATLLANGKVLVVGGQDMWNSNDEDVERSELYDPVSNRWSGVAPDPRFAARQYHTATMLPDGRVLVAGGTLDLEPTGTAALYDPRTNSWIEVPHMTRPRCGQGAVLLPTGYVLMAGSGCWTTFASSVEEFDTRTDNWYAVAGLQQSRGSGIAVGLLDGTVLSAGGISPIGASDDAEVFHSG